RKIKQVLLNLLSNAVKFTPEGGRIEGQAELANDTAEISVTDTGVGIAPEDHAAVFEEFRQVGTDYARKHEGTGLGLALARKFVELHGGKIWVKSQVGQGSTLTFAIPISRWGHHDRRADPRRRGQRQEPQAGAGRADRQGLSHRRGGDGRGRRAPGRRAVSRTRADGHPAPRHQRDRGPAPAPRRPGHRRNPRHRGHRLRDDPGPAEDPRRRVRCLSVEANQHPALPRPRSRSPRPAERGASMSEPARILVVDDTPVNLKLLGDLLSAKGYQVSTAASGAEALEKIDKTPPDLVLLDVMMPGMSGYEVCKKLRENPTTAVLPVVMVTALDPAQERV